APAGVIVAQARVTVRGERPAQRDRHEQRAEHGQELQGPLHPPRCHRSPPSNWRTVTSHHCRLVCGALLPPVGAPPRLSAPRHGTSRLRTARLEASRGGPRPPCCEAPGLLTV